MTQDEIIQMAKQAGARQMVSSLTHPKGPVTALKFDLDSDALEVFGKLVAAKEREACAKICDKGVDTPHPTVEGIIMKDFGSSFILATAIRERGKA